MDKIDWESLGEVSQTCLCRCGGKYRSRAKYVASKETLVSELPCPDCGKTEGHLWKIESDPEEWTI